MKKKLARPIATTGRAANKDVNPSGAGSGAVPSFFIQFFFI